MNSNWMFNVSLDGSLLSHNKSECLCFNSMNLLSPSSQREKNQTSFCHVWHPICQLSWCLWSLWTFHKVQLHKHVDYISTYNIISAPHVILHHYYQFFIAYDCSLTGLHSLFVWHLNYFCSILWVDPQLGVLQERVEVARHHGTDAE